MPPRGAACSFARACHDRAPVMIVTHIPPWIKKEYFVRLRVEHLPEGLPLLPSSLPSPPLPLPNLNLLHHLRLAPAPALCFLFPIARVLSHQ